MATRHYRDREKHPCPFCGQGYDLSAMPQHKPRCIDNPLVASPLRAFMRAFAENGCAMTCDRYKELSGPANLPSHATVARRFGSWENFAAWCGLNAQRPGRKEYGYVPNNRRDLLRISHIREPEMQGLPCYFAWRCIREWNPKAKVYEPIGVQKVMAIR